MTAKIPTNGKSNDFYRPKKYWVIASTSVALLSLFLTRSATVKAASLRYDEKIENNSSTQSPDVGRLIVNFIDVDPNRSDSVQNNINSLSIDRNEAPGSDKVLKLDIPDEYLLDSSSRTLLYTIKPHEITTINVNVKHRREFGSPQVSTVVNFNPGNIDPEFLKENNISTESKTIYWGTVFDVATQETKYIPYNDPSGSSRLYSFPSWQIPFDTRYDYSVSNSNLNISGTFAVITPNFPSLDGTGATSSLPDNSIDVNLTVSKIADPEPEEKPDTEDNSSSEQKPDEKPDTEDNSSSEQKPDEKPDVDPDEKPDTEDNSSSEQKPDEKPDVDPDEKPDTEDNSSSEQKPDVKPEQKPDVEDEVENNPEKDIEINSSKEISKSDKNESTLNSPKSKNGTFIASSLKQSNENPPTPVAGALLGDLLTKSRSTEISKQNKESNDSKLKSVHKVKKHQTASTQNEEQNNNQVKKYPHVDRDVATAGSQHGVAVGLDDGNGFSQLGLYFSSLSGVVNFGTRI